MSDKQQYFARECLSCALSNSNTVIGYKLAFYRENFNISILEHDSKYCLEHVKPEPLSIKRQSLVQCLHELSLIKGSQLIGVRGHAPPRKFFKMVQFGAFWCIF